MADTVKAEFASGNTLDDIIDAAYKMQDAYKYTGSMYAAIDKIKGKCHITPLQLALMWEAIDAYVDKNT